MAFGKSTPTQFERAMALRKEFEEAWEEEWKMFARPQVTSADGSTGESPARPLYRRETSPGGTVHEYYADGTEVKPDNSTAEPITLGRRIVLGYARPAPIDGLANLHSLYQAESERLNTTYEANDSDPRVEFLNRAALRAVPEE